MSTKHRLRTILCCALLEIGVLMGVPMRPEQVQELMRDMNAPKIVRTTPDRPDDGEPPNDEHDKMPDRRTRYR